MCPRVKHWALLIKQEEKISFKLIKLSYFFCIVNVLGLAYINKNTQWTLCDEVCELPNNNIELLKYQLLHGKEFGVLALT